MYADAINEFWKGERPMNKQEASERKAINHIRISNRSGSMVNKLRMFKNNTFDHELAKYFLCWELLQRDHNFITEAIFENNQRADIIDLTTQTIYEIMENETIEEFNKKIKSYPDYFLIIPIKAKDVIEKGAKEVLI